MKIQPQPPERRPLLRPDDPSSIVRDAEVPYGFNRDAALGAATRRFLESLSSSGMPHLLVGAMAMLQHVDGRTTRDIDLIIAVEDMERLPGFLLEECNEWFATGTVGPMRIDLLFTANPLFATVLERHAVSRNLLEVPIRCATPQGIILLKLFALPSLYRQGNVQRAALYETDILQLLLHQPIESESLLTQLQPHMTDSDINALRQVLADIQQRINHQHRF
jgi:hypothetical protein